MGRWKPPTDHVGPNEYVGRRLFDEPMLVGARDQNAFRGLDLRHFEETRDNEFSLDRLGSTGVDKKVVGYLRVRANFQATTFRPTRAFNGWAVIGVRELTRPHKFARLSVLSVVPSPQNGVGLSENLYHAHVVRPDGVDSYFMALHLRQVFTKHGTVRVAGPAGRRKSRLFPIPPVGLRNLIRWLLQKLTLLVSAIPRGRKAFLLAKNQWSEKQ